MVLAASAAFASGCASSTANNAAAASPSPQWTVNACDMPGGWRFDDACTTGRVPATGQSMALNGRSGITTTVIFGSNSAGNETPFVVGQATAAGGVQGSLNGRLPFPGFASVPCVGKTLKPVRRCVGSALLYLLIINAGNETVNFLATPSIDVVAPGRFAGASRCALDTLVWLDASRFAAGWLARPLATVPLNANELLFAQSPVPQIYRSSGAFTVFAVVCR